MSGDSEYKRIELALEQDFELDPGQEDSACVDLDGEWSESSKVFRHPSFKHAGVEFISGEVGEGGDHANITLKNISSEKISIVGTDIVAIVTEDPNEEPPSQATPEAPEAAGTDKPAEDAGEKEPSAPAEEAAEVAADPQAKAENASPAEEAAASTEEPASEAMETDEGGAAEPDGGDGPDPQQEEEAEAAGKEQEASALDSVSAEDKNEQEEDSAAGTSAPQEETAPVSINDQKDVDENTVEPTQDAADSKDASEDMDSAEPDQPSEEAENALDNEKEMAEANEVPEDKENAEAMDDKDSETAEKDAAVDEEIPDASTDDKPASSDGADASKEAENEVPDKDKDEESTKEGEGHEEASMDAEANKEASADGEVSKEASNDAEANKEASNDAEANKEASTDAEAGKEASTDAEASKEASTDAEASKEASTDAEASKEASTDAEASKEASSDAEAKKDKEDAPAASKPPLTFRFVNETEADEEEEMEVDKDDGEKEDEGEDEAEADEKQEEEEEKEKTKKDEDDKDALSETKPEDSKDGDEDTKENGTDSDRRPTLKLASFAGITANNDVNKDKATNSETDSAEEGEKVSAAPAPKPLPDTHPSACHKDDLCAKCGNMVPGGPKAAIVWETMLFCGLACLGGFQLNMSRCASCKKAVGSQLLGKYCVRFGSNIKQFCSNGCLEYHKKGLKVCTYCQKDISGGEGFLAPMGDQGVFKDFCEKSCLTMYQVRNMGKEKPKETIKCGVCKESKPMAIEIVREKEKVTLCEMPSCLSAYKFVNNVSTMSCEICERLFDAGIKSFPFYHDGAKKSFCTRTCLNVYVMAKRKIIPCANCKVKKYNYDMVEVWNDGRWQNLFCSLFCYNKFLDFKNMSPNIAPKPVISSPGFSDHQQNLPVISAISSLAPVNQVANEMTRQPGVAGVMPQLPTQPLPPSHMLGGPQPHIKLPEPLPPPPPQIQIQTQTIKEVVKDVVVMPPEMPTVKNKGVQTKPYMVTKSVACKPHPCHKDTQTEETITHPVIVPVPVPIHVPTPVRMYNAPFPVPVPIPLPFPVPVFIPTTRKSIKGIMKQIKKIQNKIPADPFEAELLALAGNIAAEEKDSDDSGSEDDGSEPENGRSHGHNMHTPAPDLENEMAAERIIPKPLPISTPEPPGMRQFPPYQQQFPTANKHEDDGEGEDDAWRNHQWDQKSGMQQRQVAQKRSRPRTQQNTAKRQRTDTITRDPSSAAQTPQQPKERPDANHHLKFTYGVNAWKHWVVGKNAELEKQRAQGKYQKSFETDILKLRADELNFTLCMFVKEVKKPNGDSYAADSIFYLVLGIQEYLFENGRIDNIFTDVYYDPFTSALHEVIKEFKLPVNELGYFVTRIEEEHLWEAKQLGAHSPHVLLNTLVYFNTKYFQLTTVDQHLKLSFNHIMKHWKKSASINKQQRTVLLRYYPPPVKGQKNEDRKMYEQHENVDNPLRCPVKLYEFYLSKCPESTKNRTDMFYLQPERSCVPDSPVWYSVQLLNRYSMEKMLSRILMVREVQEHMLADQAS